MQDYKKTLNLPSTKFSMRADLVQNEPIRLSKWKNSGHYKKLKLNWSDRIKFIINDGPPYANGAIHMGHAVNKILKDIVARSKVISGYDVEFKPGWDCHGLPIELHISKQIKSSNRHNADLWRKACRQHAKEQVEIQKKAFERLGIIADWENPYLTMDPKYEADILCVLARITELGYVKKDLKPVHWCYQCNSALADAELEYHDKSSFSLFVLFQICAVEDLIKDLAIGSKKAYLVAWTTTPWTLVSNRALAVLSDASYSLILSDQLLLIVATARLAELKNIIAQDYVVLREFYGYQLIDKEVKHPFLDRTVRIVTSEHVELTTGTGIVHIAPAHGPEDFVIGKRYNLDLSTYVERDGCYSNESPIFAGQHIFLIDQAIIDVISENKNLLFSQLFSHSYPYCWRHKVPTFFLATKQWFIDLSSMKEQLIQSLEHVSTLPKWGIGMLTNMTTKRPDWCISRQRAWGVPIPIFSSSLNSIASYSSLQVIAQAASLIEQGGIEAYFKSDLFKKNIGDHDVLDVWFDSGCAGLRLWDNNLNQNNFVPADIVIEGSDQHRGWFQSSLIISTACFKKPPYKQIITHGFVVDEKKRKMSKSIGNVICPIEIVDKLGADVLRLWVASCDYSVDMVISQEILDSTVDMYRKIRNTCRFLLGSLGSTPFSQEHHLLANHDLLLLDQYIIWQASKLQQQLIDAYNEYQFHKALRIIINFCTRDLSNFYLELVKDRQYTSHKKSRAFLSAQTTAFHLLNALLRWLAPIMPFTAEEISEYLLPDKTDPMLLQWYCGLSIEESGLANDQAFWTSVYSLREQYNKVLEQKKQDGILNSSLEAKLSLGVLKDMYKKLCVIQSELNFLFMVAEVELFQIEHHNSNEDTNLAQLEITKSSYIKCERCWNRVAYLLEGKICARCSSNLSSANQHKRLFI